MNPETDRADEPHGQRAAVLERRARRLARSHEHTADPRAASDWLADLALVRCGGREIGLATESLREILPRPPITPLPAADPRIVGLAQVRGRILAVAELAVLLGDAESGSSADRRGPAVDDAGHLALVETSRGPLGLLVDEVAGFRRLRRSEMTEGFRRGEGASPVQGVTRDLVLVVDVEHLLPGAAETNRP